MDYSLQIFVPECNLPAESKVRDRLGARLNLKPGPGKPSVPLLLRLVQLAMQGASGPSLLEARDSAPESTGPDKLQEAKVGKYNSALDKVQEEKKLSYSKT